MGTAENFIHRLKMSIISFKQSQYKAQSSLQCKYKHKHSMVHSSDSNMSINVSIRGLWASKDGFEHKHKHKKIKTLHSSCANTACNTYAYGMTVLTSS